MNSVDRAIRNALAKGDASDPAFREKVYRSVFSAFERVTEANSAITPEAADRRRKALADRIRAIEGQFQEAQAAVANEAEDRASEADDREEVLAPGSPEAPEIELEDRRPPSGPPPSEITTETSNKVVGKSRGGQKRPRKSGRRRRPFTWFFVIALLCAAIGMAIWWTHESGILLSPAQRDTSVPNPPRTFTSEDYRPGNNETPMRQSEGQHRSWINIFNPGDPTTVSAQSGATAEITGEGKDKVLRIRSTTPEDAIIFDVGPGVLQQLVGKTAVFDIVASSEENKPTEISVACEFGKLGNCIRKRYNVGATPSEYLFEMNFSDTPSDKAGSIAIVSDVNGTGLVVDIREIRVATEK